MSWALEDALSISLAAGREQWDRIKARPVPGPGERQERFLPVEVILCLMASLFIDHRAFGGSTAGSAPTPVPELARSFKRPPTSILAKMANLDGSRPNGGKHDQELATRLLDDPNRLMAVYEVARDSATLAELEQGAIPEMARLPLLPKWVGTPVSGALARYVMNRWDQIPDTEATDQGSRAPHEGGEGALPEPQSDTEAGDGLVVDELRDEAEQRIAELIVDLSRSSLVPSEVVLKASDLDLSEVTFDDDSWFDGLVGVQDFLRLDQPLVTRRAKDAWIKSLAIELGREDWGQLLDEERPSRLSQGGLDLLQQRLERAVQLRDAFVEEVEGEGASRRAATGMWMTAWDEAQEESETEAAGAILAEADVWPISDIKAHAERGRLNLSPSYQRGDVWPNTDAQLLMESIIRGIPLPSVILLRTTEAGRSVYEVIDGKQRLTAILRFTASHPTALDHVAKVASQERDASLPELFRDDYPAFRRRWQEITGTTLTTTRERELYFPFKLRSNCIPLSGPLEPLQGKYYSQVKNMSVQVAGRFHEVADIFETNATKYKLPMITYDDAASPQQIHEVFNLYNKQGKHLNAEEIRNARYHKQALMRALLATAGDAQDPLEVAPFLSLNWGDLRTVQSILDSYGFGAGRYQRTKVLSWVTSLVVYDGVQEGRYRQRSTAAHINALMDRIEQNSSDPLRNSGRVTDLMTLLSSGIQIHSSNDVWADSFKNSRRTGKWQELQLVASILGVTLAVAAMGEGQVLRRMRQAGDLLYSRSDSAWKRPIKTQTTQQWQFISSVALGVPDVLGVDLEELEGFLKDSFGSSGLQALLNARPEY